jgi:large repetitive protein
MRMVERISKGYKSKKSLIMVFSVCLLLVSVLVFSTNAFSLDGAKRYIVFNEERWDLESSFDKDWMTNQETITFKVDLKEDFIKNNDSENPLDPADRPFAIFASYPGTETTANIEPVLDAEGIFQGEYSVTIGLNSSVADDKLAVKVDFLEENTWKIPSLSSSFTIGRDATVPSVDVTTLFEDGRFTDGDFTKKPVSMSITVNEANFVPTEDTVSILKDGIAYQPTQPHVWKNNQTTLYLDNTGFYEVTIVAADKAGNKSQPEKVTFGIVKQGPRLTITDREESGLYKKDVELRIDSDILIYEAIATIEKTVAGVTTTEVQNFVPYGKTAKLTLTEDAGYKVHVVVKDRQNISDGHQLGVTEFTIDKTAPVLAVTGVEDRGEYSDSKNVKLNVTDVNIDVNRTELTVTRDKEVTTYQGEEAYKQHHFSEEGVYVLDVIVADWAGNTATQTLTFIIDKSQPALAITGVQDGEFYNAEKNRKAVVLSVEDLTLALNEDQKTLNPEKTVLEVRKDGEVFAEPITFSIEGSKAVAKHTFTAEGSYKISLKSTDKLGHAAPEKMVAFTIDNTDPKSVVMIDGVAMEEEEAVFNAEKMVKITVSDKHHDTYNVSVLKNGKNYPVNPLVLEGEKATSEHLFKEDGVYEIKVEATDQAGNHTLLTKIITIDTGAPAIHFSGVENKEHYKSEKVDVTISIDDFTFNKEKTTLKMTRTNGEQVTELKPGNWTIFDQLRWMYRGEMDLSFEEEGDYILSVTSEDKFGGQSTSKLEFTIDRTVPKVEIGGIGEGAFVQNGELSIKVNEKYYETNNVTVTVDKDGVKSEETFNNVGVTSELALAFAEDGDYQVTVTAEDKAGNKASFDTSTLSRSFTVDTVKPEISLLDVGTGVAVINHEYTAANKTVMIEVLEHNFKNNNVSVEVIEKNTITGESKTVNIGEWKNVGERTAHSYEFKEEYEYTITAEAKDAAGNSAGKKSVTFTVDHTNPLLTIEGIEKNMDYQQRTAVVRVEDTNLDLAHTNLKVLKDGQPYDVGKLALTGKTVGTLSIPFTKEGNYEVTLDATDKAGRKSVHDKIMFIIDSTNPVVKIEGVEHQSFYPTPKNVTVSVNEKNFSTNMVDLVVTKDNEPFSMGSLITNRVQLSKLSNTFDRDGLYSILITAKDKAGNGPVSENRTFTIDQTKPAIEISGVGNGEHYNEDKLVNVAIRDVNLDSNKITVTRNGSHYSAGSFSVSNNTASLRHSFSAEGEYHIVVDATDKAGNTFSQQMRFTIDKTKPVVTPKFKNQNRVIKDGEYINELFTPEFALDMAEDEIVSITLNGSIVGKTAPTASKEMAYHFTGLARDKAGNETTFAINFTVDTTKPALTISGVLDGFFNNDIAPMVTYSDVHLDAKRTSVTLNNEIYKNGTKLERERDYILKATVTDLANNVSSRTIVFTIDKTAPVIKFKEPISNMYFKNDLIPEMLIEDFSAYDIIALTLDGQEYQLGDPITSEGKHVLYFEVKDKAGNMKQVSVEFIIDKTAPKVIHDGIKRNKTYYEPVKATIRLDNPTDRIKSIMINGKLHNFDQTTDENGFKVFTTTFGEFKSYKIEVVAEDEAENRTNIVIPFEIAEKTMLTKLYENKPLFAGSIAGVLALLAGGTALILKRRKVVVEE